MKKKSNLSYVKIISVGFLFALLTTVACEKPGQDHSVSLYKAKVPMETLGEKDPVDISDQICGLLPFKYFTQGFFIRNSNK